MKILACFMFYSIVSAFPKNKALSSTLYDYRYVIDNLYPSGHPVITNTPCGTNLPKTTEELINKLLVFVKDIVENGEEELGIPPLEPIQLDNYILVIPARLIFLHLNLKDIIGTGFGEFNIHNIKLDIKNLTFDVDLEFPKLHIVADKYNLLGYVYSFIPLYGSGRAEFRFEGYRLKVKLLLGQSEDGKSVLIKKVDNITYIAPYMKSNLTGVLGGGDIDAIVNTLIEEVVLDYINRFHGIIGIITSQASVAMGNTILRQLHTWCYIDALQHKQE